MRILSTAAAAIVATLAIATAASADQAAWSFRVDSVKDGVTGRPIPAAVVALRLNVSGPLARIVRQLTDALGRFGRRAGRGRQAERVGQAAERQRVRG